MKPGPPRPLEVIQRVLLFAGAGGTLLLTLAALGAQLSRLWARDEALVTFIGIIVVFTLMLGWMLPPYWGALKLQRQRSNTRAEGVILILALVLMIAFAAYSYLATSAFVGGKPHPTADGVTIAFIPMVQWVVLGLAVLLRRIARGVSDTSSR